MTDTILTSSAAGRFYPAQSDVLRSEVNELLDYALQKNTGVSQKPAALIVPHAGYVFSGFQAARAYNLCRGHDYDLVCIISPSHTVWFSYLSTYNGSALATPLGNVPVTSSAEELLRGRDDCRYDDKGYRGEHALEVQLSFLQCCLKDFSLFPVIMGDQSREMIAAAAELIRDLKSIYKDRILFVISSDLSHFHSAGAARKMDERFMALCRDFRIDDLQRELEAEKVEACGGGPVAACLTALDKDHYTYLDLGYSHSGEILHDNDSVVGYTSAVLIRKETHDTD